MEDAEGFLDGEVPRRKFLGLTGSAATAGMAGCSGNGQEGSSNGDSGSGGTGTDSPSGSGGNGSGTEETDSGSQGTEDSGSTGSTGNEPGEYPTQETSGLMAEADQLADETAEAYAFKIDDYDFLNIDEFPNILDGVEESSLEELAETGGSQPYDKALYVAANMQLEDRESNSLYFLVPDVETSRQSTAIYVGLEEAKASNLGEAAYVAANEDSDESPENRLQHQADFFRDHIDPDGIVHAVDLDEHDYAVEALHSGFGSE